MLKFRLISGTLIVTALLLLAKYSPPIGCMLLQVLMTFLCLMEFYAMVEKTGTRTFKKTGVLCGIAILASTLYTVGPTDAEMANAYRWEMIALLACVIALLVRYVASRRDGKTLVSIAGTFLGLLYVPYLMNFFSRLVYEWDGAQRGVAMGSTGKMLLLYAVVAVKSTDIGAYAIGRMFGKHKLCPSISPGKTWEGFVGGVFTAVLASYAFWHVVDGKLGKVTMELHDAIILGFLLSIVGVLGDLFESSLKRAAKVKDSGKSIPGMGGLLDVLDSLLFGVPVLYIYICVFMS